MMANYRPDLCETRNYGTAQVRAIGEAKNDESLRLRVSLISEYIENWSLVLDFLLILEDGLQGVLFLPALSSRRRNLSGREWNSIRDTKLSHRPGSSPEPAPP